MHSTSSSHTQKAKNSKDDSSTALSPPLLRESQHGSLSATSSHDIFTLSNPLVQFLSPLQLQGFASRLIESRGLRHMDELAAWVTSEDDVDKLLGLQASLQQRQDFWKGLCRWKRTAGKRSREPTKKSESKRAVVDVTHSNPQVLQGKTHTSTTHQHITLNTCTPSQFMRQFAFHGQKKNEERLVTEQSMETVINNFMENMGEAACDNNDNNIDDDNSGEREVAVMSSFDNTPRRSFSWASSTSPFGGDTHCNPEKRYRRERLPISTLSMGPEVLDLSKNDPFSQEWGIPCKDAEPKRKSGSPTSSSLALNEESGGGGGGGTTTSPTVPMRKVIEECCAEHEELWEIMSTALKKAVATYNEGLLGIQERIRTLLEEVNEKKKDAPNCTGGEDDDDDTVLEIAEGFCCKLPLRLEIHSAEFSKAGTISFVTQTQDPYEEEMDETIHRGCCNQLTDKDNNNNNKCNDNTGCIVGNPVFCEIPTTVAELNENRMRPSSLVNDTIVSTPSGNLGGNDAIPSLSDITSSGRGSYRYTDTLALEELTRRQSTIMHLNTREEEIPNLTMNENSHSIPVAFSLGEESRLVSSSANHGDETSVDVTEHCERNGAADEELLLPRPATAEAAATVAPSIISNVHVDMTSRRNLVDESTRGAFLLDDFGLQALGKERTNLAHTLCPVQSPSRGEELIGSKNPGPTAVESQVIDVDALSSLESDLEEEKGEVHSSLRQGQDDNCCCVIPVDDCSDQTASHNSTPMALRDESSREESFLMYTQVPRGRQRAVSRSASLSPDRDSNNAFMDSLSLSVNNSAMGVMDWTTTSSMVADVHDLVSRLQKDEDKREALYDDETGYVSNPKVTRVVRAESGALPPYHSLAPEGLPPLPTRNAMERTLFDKKESLNSDAAAIEQLTSEGIMSMSYDVLHQWCLRLGLRLFFDKTNQKSNKVQDSSFNTTTSTTATARDVNTGQEDCCDFTFTQGENSNGWWLVDGDVNMNEEEEVVGDNDDSSMDGSQFLRSPDRHITGEEHDATTTTPQRRRPLLSSTVNADDSECQSHQRAALIEEMREALQLFISRRKFMQEVVPFFFHRLPKFSDGPPYKPLRAADLVKSQIALTRQDLEERRRWAKVKEAEEMVCCVITSLAGDAVERIEQQAATVLLMHSSGNEENMGDNNNSLQSTCMRARSPLMKKTTAACNAVDAEISVYEQLLLMEPADVQAVSAIVQADFPHISRHRLETLLEESGIPLNQSRALFNNQSDGRGGMNGTQRSATASCSPPPCSPPPPPPPLVSPCSSQTGQTTNAQENKKRFFAQRTWMQRRKNR